MKSQKYRTAVLESHNCNKEIAAKFFSYLKEELQNKSGGQSNERN